MTVNRRLWDAVGSAPAQESAASAPASLMAASAPALAAETAPAAPAFTAGSAPAAAVAYQPPSTEGLRLYGRALTWLLLASVLVALAGAGGFAFITQPATSAEWAVHFALFVAIGLLTGLVNFGVLNSVVRHLLIDFAREMEQTCGLTANVEHEHHTDQAIRNFAMVLHRVLGAFRDKSAIVRRVAAVSQATLEESAAEIVRLRLLLGDLRKLHERLLGHRQHWAASRQRITDLVLPSEQLLALSIDPQGVKSVEAAAGRALALAERLRGVTENFAGAAASLRAESRPWQRVPELLEESNGRMNAAAVSLAASAAASPEVRGLAENLRALADQLLTHAAEVRQGGGRYAEALQQMDKLVGEARTLLYENVHELDEVAHAMAETVRCIDAQRAHLQELHGRLQAPTLQMAVSDLLTQTITALEGSETAAGQLLASLDQEADNLERLREIAEEINPVIQELNHIMFDFGSVPAGDDRPA